MKVILRADVENLGVLGDVVEVKPGYGRNFLLPKGLAMMATSGNLKAFELERKKLQEKMEAVRGAAQDLAAKLEKADVVLQVRVGENDKLYGSVTATNIAETLAAQGIDIDRRRILLDAPIRVLGEYPVRVRLHAGVIAEILVKVAPEGRLVEEETPAVADVAAEEAAE
ncbi:50S ribosomal protein L9 [Desulfovibrio mangrovi]|uniref:50S ribosomal protein L9 n=1 Tax=Desulfovibrio mangrovi TaxID=2976983 RepID=UPI002246C5BD|nr:50S ribosomal protein L9 [Desulfovibrio mangrovi]UZP68821.1 50S ribosomal protein L9 [Desulfovibrio mangrovi]